MNQSLEYTEALNINNIDEEVTSEEFSLTPHDYVAVYARKSLTNDNNSIVGQLQRAQELIQEKKLLLFKEYIDDGISASMTEIEERKGLNQLLSDAKHGKFKTVIVYKSDRLARNPEQAIKIRNIFKDNHINVIYSSQKDFVIPNDYMGDFIQNVLIGLDELEALTIAKRISSGKHSKRLRGEYSSSTPPFGYTRFTGSESDIDTKYLKGSPSVNYLGFYLPNQNAYLIENLFLTYSKINLDEEKDLTQDELVSFAKAIFELEGININASTINNYINNTVYGGFLKVYPDTDNKQIFPDDNEGNYIINYDLIKECSNLIPVVDPNTYIRAFWNWTKIYEKKERKRYTYLFNNLLYCKCGKKIHGSANKYKCSTKKCTSIKKDYLENALLNRIIQDLMDKSYLENCIKERIIEKVKNIHISISTLKTRLKSINKRQTMLLRELVSDPNNNMIQIKLNIILSKEAEFTTKLDLKEKQLHSISSIFFKTDDQSIRTLSSKDIKLNQEKLHKITSYLSNSSDVLLHKNNIETTLNSINLIIEKVIIYARGEKTIISNIDYGN